MKCEEVECPNEANGCKTTCCCGGPIDHAWDGHDPVSMHWWYCEGNCEQPRIAFDRGWDMKIDFPDHVISKWSRTPWWLFWKPGWRRYHWRWTVDWRGCECIYAWQYAPRGFWPGDFDRTS